jgi:hypothetical protein
MASRVARFLGATLAADCLPRGFALAATSGNQIGETPARLVQTRFPLVCSRGAAQYLLNLRLLNLLQLAFYLCALVVIGSLEPSALVFGACNIVGDKAYGDCSGVRVNRGAQEYLTVRSYISQTGIIGGATILNGGVLDLSGVSNGDISVNEGGRLRLSGIVNGTVKNLGGSVEVEGILNHLHTTGGDVVVGGNVGSISGEGEVKFKEEAVIGGVPVD